MSDEYDKKKCKTKCKALLVAKKVKQSQRNETDITYVSKKNKKIVTKVIIMNGF